MITDLSITDRLTLRRAVSLLAGARADAASPDPKVAAPAKLRSITSFGYLIGFLDGRGLIPALNPGYDRAFEAPPPSDPEAALDQLQRTVGEMIDDPTRSTPAGALVGAIVYAIGVYLASR